MSSGKKDKSGVKYSLKGRLSSSFKLKDGFQEKRIVIQLQISRNNFLNAIAFSPEEWIRMVEILHIIEGIKEWDTSEKEFHDANESLKPVIKNIISNYSSAIEELIGRHFLQAIGSSIEDIKDLELNFWKKDIDDIMKYFREYDHKIAIYILESSCKECKEEMRNELEPQKRKDILLNEMDAFLDTIEDDLNDEENKNMAFTNQNLRKILIEYWSGDLGIENWFKVWDLMKAIPPLFQKEKDTSVLNEYLAKYWSVFLSKGRINSEIDIYKELEENLRYISHHSGNLVSGFDDRKQSDKFFELLSRYGEPTLNEWKEEMDNLLEEAGL